jgi:hypothetical protein
MSADREAGARELLRHTIATVAYRGGKAVRHSPPAFPAFKAGPATRTPSEILAHIGDLYDWALTMARGNTVWHDSTPLAWDAEVSRFFAALSAFDAFLAGGEPLAATPQKLFQGPVADSLNHIGQLTMLRRLAGSPVRGENYARADIAAGRVGDDQAAPRSEFD